MGAQNAIDADRARSVVAEIEEQLTELLSLRGSYMAACKRVREDIKAIKDEAHEAGIPRKALNLELKRRDLARKAAALDEADEDVTELANQIREAIGGLADLPLGEAAIKKAGGDVAEPAPKPKRGRKKAAPEDKAAALDEIAGGNVDDDVRPAFLREKDHVKEAAAEMEERRQARENAARLEGGIRPLN